MSKIGVKFVAISAFKTQLIKMHQNHLECFNLMEGGSLLLLCSYMSWFYFLVYILYNVLILKKSQKNFAMGFKNE